MTLVTQVKSMKEKEKLSSDLNAMGSLKNQRTAFVLKDGKKVRCGRHRQSTQSGAIQCVSPIRKVIDAATRSPLPVPIGGVRSHPRSDRGLTMRPAVSRNAHP